MKLLVLILSLAFILSANTSWAEESNQEEIQLKELQLDGLSDKDRKIYKEGRIETWQMYSAGIMNGFVGFGSGYAFQGRYLDKGWKITATEFGSLLILLGSGFASHQYASRNKSPVGFIAVYVYIGTRIYSIYDSFAAPIRQNKEYERVQRTLRQKPDVNSYLVPTNDGFQLGVVYNF